MINIVIILAILFNVTNAFFTTIKTGDVGVAFVWNEIQKDLYYPGLTIYNSLTTRVEIVDILPQTDEVLNVECGTKDGIKAKFDKVQIGNQLKSEYVIKTISHFGLNYDKYLVTDLVRHQINVICSKKTAHEIAIDYFDQLDDELYEFIKNENERQETGLIIHFVRLSKPILPESIQKNYLALAEERTMKKVIEEKKERTRAEKETEILISQKDSEIALNRAKSDNDKMILNMKAKQEEQRIQNEMIIESAKANAAKIMTEAQALKTMYELPGYSEIKMAEAISSNQKIYYGDKLPQMAYPLLNQKNDL
jgi:regulator of protease activity HflC (stomatin/prohibitin superfamily)